MTPTQRRNLTRLLSPKQIAFIGGRDCVTAIGEARRRGFKGEIWPVNPTRAEISGYPCFKTVEDLPSAPDAVFMAVPAKPAIDVLRSLAARGSGGVVCYTAGFREAGDEGAVLEAALVEAAGEMALIGPNCYGAINFQSNTALWPFAHGGSCPNGEGAAIVTQSGMLSSDILMSQRGLPITHMISCGNQAVLSLEDFLEFLVDEQGVKAIGLHIEGLRDVPRFHRVALQANAKGVPIVALKTGTSKIGSSLTVSHTGSLSGSDSLYDALFERCGVIRVETPPELLETLKFLVIAGVPSANRIAGFTCSGGGATMLADRGERIGLQFPEIPYASSATLEALLPPIATVSNPLDYTTPIWGNAERTRPVFLEAMKQTGASATILVQDYPASGLDESLGFYRADAEALVLAAKERGIPAAILATLHENIDPDTRDWLVGQSCVPLLGIYEGLGALKNAVWWGQRHRSIQSKPPMPLTNARAVGDIKQLTEADSKALLTQHGLPIPKAVRVCALDMEISCAEMRFPVVLKMMGPLLAHKSEAGAVVLGIHDITALNDARVRMTNAVRSYNPEAVTDDFIVEEMVEKPIAELLVSMRRDPDFGPSLTLAAGGVLVELLQDSTNLLMPVNDDELANAIASLKISALLKGYRGGAAANSEQLNTVITDLQRLFLANETLAEIEINPLFVGRDQSTIVDALIHVYSK